MKMISKIAGTALTVAVVTSGVFAQSIEDAKKALNAEQYQKAKTMLQNLTKTQADKGENYFYLGQVYLKTDYLDSAKMVFQKGVTADPKNSINYAGLGAVTLLEGNAAGAKTSFTKAISEADRKDIMPAIYVAKAYVDIPKAYQATVKPNGPAALAVLDEVNKKIEKVTSKSPDYFLARGDAYRSQLKNSEAYQAYAQALQLNPKLAAAQVAIGVGWKQANNYDAAQKEFTKALSIDPNYGPTYREMAETKLQQGLTATDTTTYKQTLKAAVEDYKKYLSKTDMSLDSRIRYADFLVYAQDYKGLEREATALAQMDKNKNPKVQRYLAYAKYENGDNQGGLEALQKFMQQAGPKRIIPRDYLYLGRMQIKLGQDTAGITNLKKAITLDTTQVDLLDDIAKTLYTKKQYKAAGDAYDLFVNKSKKATLGDRVRGGLSYYLAYYEQYEKKEKDKAAPEPDKTLLTKADSAYSYVQSKTTKPSNQVELLRARANNAKEKDPNTITGLAKPFYEKYIELSAQPGATPNPKALAEAYAYLGAYYAYTEKDAAKAVENFNKAKEIDPANQQAQYYFSQGSKAAGKGK